MAETILVAVDGSEASAATVETARSIASGTDATVHLLTVVEPAGSPIAFDVDDVEEIYDAVSDLAEVIRSSDGTPAVSLEIEVRRGSPVHEMILSYADEVDADIIVIGRGGTSLPDRIFGSTTDRIARLTEVPVVLVPLPE